jgi:hypothetical protein
MSSNDDQRIIAVCADGAASAIKWPVRLSQALLAGIRLVTNKPLRAIVGDPTE